MTHTLLVLNALALSAVVALTLLPDGNNVNSLQYRTSMQAHKAVLGQSPSVQVSPGQAIVPATHQSLSF